MVYWCGGGTLIFHKGWDLIKGYLDICTMKIEQSFYGSQNSKNNFPFLLSIGMVLSNKIVVYDWSIHLSTQYCIQRIPRIWIYDKVIILVIEA